MMIIITILLALVSIFFSFILVTVCCNLLPVSKQTECEKCYLATIEKGYCCCYYYKNKFTIRGNEFVDATVGGR